MSQQTEEDEYFYAQQLAMMEYELSHATEGNCQQDYDVDLAKALAASEYEACKQEFQQRHWRKPNHHA